MSATIVRAIPCDDEQFAVTLSDGRAGLVNYNALLHGTGLVKGWLRRETVAVNKTADGVEVEWHTYSRPGKQGGDVKHTFTIGQIIKELRQGPVVIIPVTPRDSDGKPAGDAVDLVLMWDGKFREQTASDEESKKINSGFVEEWWNFRGQPRAGTLITTGRGGRGLAYWKIL